MLFAATGMTAAEILADRANSALNNMGLKTWKGAGRGRHLTKADTIVAKNYLDEEEMRTLELFVGQYLDFAELQARQGHVMYMADWKAKLDDFLRLNNQEVLSHAGKISAKIAQELAHAQYETFDKNRRKLEADQSEEELRQTIKRIAQKSGEA